MRGRIVCLMGPTASGKTALAIELVQKYPFEIISVDSALVYQGLNIGSAKPSSAELALAPHHLISFLDPSKSYSVSRFREEAVALIHAIWARGNTPLLVGGSMLYFRALLLGLSDLPSANPVIRAEIDAELQSKGWDSLYSELEQVDPVAAARINRNDSQRLQRALEVYRISGRPLSDFQQQEADHQTLAPQYAEDIGENPLQIAIMPDDRAVLHQRIEQRFTQMLNNGFLEEVQALYARGDLTPSMPAIRAVGYRQVWAYLDNEYDYDEMVFRGIVATRQLAKRQLTWLRNWQGLMRFHTDADNRQIVGGDYQKQLLFDAVEESLLKNLAIKPRLSL